MSSHDAELEADVLAAAQRDDEAALREAIQRLVDEALLPAAKRAARGRSRQVDVQAESVVQSVIADELPQAIAECADESHLRARLVQAVKHKVIDRLRKGGRGGRPIQFSQGQLEADFDPARSHRSPASQVASRERNLASAEAHQRFKDALLALAASDADRTLLQRFVLAGESWKTAAEAAGLRGEAARQRLSRLRSRSLVDLFAPLRDRLDGETWTIAEGVFIKRSRPADLAQTLGVSEAAIERVCQQSVFPALASLYGGESVEPILRLMGSKRLSRQ